MSLGFQKYPIFEGSTNFTAFLDSQEGRTFDGRLEGFSGAGRNCLDNFEVCGQLKNRIFRWWPING